VTRNARSSPRDLANVRAAGCPGEQSIDRPRGDGEVDVCISSVPKTNGDRIATCPCNARDGDDALEHLVSCCLAREKRASILLRGA
jgi:hypothetical protein